MSSQAKCFGVGGGVYPRTYARMYVNGGELTYAKQKPRHDQNKSCCPITVGNRLGALIRNCLLTFMRPNTT